MFDGLLAEPTVRSPATSVPTHNILSKQEFKTWLRLRPSGDSLAVTYNNRSCPIAIWLKDCGYVAPQVGCTVWNHFDDGVLRRHFLPPWAKEFVLTVDITNITFDATAGQCLMVLSAT